MKKTLLGFLFMGISLLSVNSQTLVSTEVEKKNVVLEEFTGIHCGYCPEGHAIAQQIHDDHHGDVVVIAIHQGSFATPSAGEPDFRTAFGDPIANQTALTGYPAGTVNRHFFQDLASNGGTAMGRGSWATAAGRILTEESPVNVGFESIYNETTRELTVNVELYYTGDSPESSNFINVALLQSNILGPQSGGGMGNNYVHNHMLRHLITGQWGDEVTTTTTGSFVERTYTYTVPEDYTDVPVVIEDCDIAVFVTESQQEIYSGTYAKLNGGTTLIVGEFSDITSTFATGTSGVETIFEFNAISLMPGTESFTFDLGSNKEWSATFEIDGTTYSSAVSLDLDNGVAVPVKVKITPDASSDIQEFNFTMTADANPNYFPIQQSFSVLSNVSELVLHNQGSWAGGVPADFEQIYFDGISSAGVETYASMSYKQFMDMANAAPEVVNEFNSIFYNVAWTFPGMTDEIVAVLTDYLDNGGNLFIAGQDLGWDTWDASGNGTAITQEFYTNYLHASYNNDGSTANNSINAEETDPIFGGIASSSLTDAYGGNMYPDEIEPVGDDATSIFYYNNNTAKSCAVKVNNGTYKVVYLGFDPAMVSNATVQNDIIKNSAGWFASSFFASASIENEITCNGVCDGAVQLTAFGGTEPYTFDWADPAISDESYVDGLCAGTYEITVSDQGGVNTQTVFVTLEEPALMEITNIEVTPSSGGTVNDGSITITIEGGSGDYSILWDDPEAQTSATATNLAPGDYTVVVTDNNCDEEVTETITVGIGIDESNKNSLVSIFPNPSNGKISIDLGHLQNVNLEIYSITGRKVFSTNQEIDNQEINIDLSHLENGVYFIRVTNDEISINKSFTITK